MHALCECVFGASCLQSQAPVRMCRVHGCVHHHLHRLSTGDLTVFLEPKAAFATAPAHGGLALPYMCDAARSRPVQAWGPLVSSPKSHSYAMDRNQKDQPGSHGSPGRRLTGRRALDRGRQRVEGTPSLFCKRVRHGRAHR
jgi:hypothetical protein